MNGPIKTGGEAMPRGPSPEYCAAWAKCRELGKELSQALKETGDDQYAFVRPAGIDFAVLFGSRESDTLASDFVGHAVDRVSRLSSELSVALDEWNGQTKVQYMAHVPPASSGLSIWYENARRGTDMPQGSEAVGRIRELANEVAMILVANPDLKIDRVSINEHGVHQFRKIPGVPSVEETL